MRRLAIAAAAVGTGLALAAGAGGQTTPPGTTMTTTTIPPAPVPKLLFAPRDLRMSLGGVIRARAGCSGIPGDVCSGRLDARLLGHVDLPIRQHPAPNGSDPTRRVGSFTMGRAKLLVSVGRARAIDVRLNSRARRMVRILGRVSVQLVARYRGRSGRRGRNVESIAVYVPHAFRIRR